MEGMTSARWPHDVRVPRHRGRSLIPWVGALVIVLLSAIAPQAVLAEGDGGTDMGSTVDAATDAENDGAGANDDQLRAGAAVYSAICASCHQPGGVGLAGRYPPLLNNPNVADAAYISEVIANGRQGEITVNGETYNGVMPAQSSLTQAEIESVIVYIQSGFAAPAAAVVEVPTGPVAGTELPLLADYAWLGAFALAALVLAMALGPRVIAAHDRRELSWVDAWMKTAVIVVTGVLFTTIVPAKVLENGTVQTLPRSAQDLIAVGLWAGCVMVMIAALWYAYRERRI